METVKMQHVETGAIREMSRTQVKLIGENPVTNGGWEPASPVELEPIENSDQGADDQKGILEGERLKYEQLTGNKAGNKKLETLQKEIAEYEEEQRSKAAQNA